MVCVCVAGGLSLAPDEVGVLAGVEGPVGPDSWKPAHHAPCPPK